jgi:predicted  nucleic acid-binding Zn-ribbon protein
MTTDLDDLYNRLFSMLKEQDKPVLGRIITAHKEREKELLDEIEAYQSKIQIDEKEFDDIVKEIESMMNAVDQSIDETTNLKEIISKIRSLRIPGY